jgi:hypothetical protein
MWKLLNRRLYNDLNFCVEEYKKSEGKKKDEIYKKIQEHLTHHINSICNILLDKNYPVNKTVSKMMIAGFYATSKKGDIVSLKTIASRLSEDDLRQEIDVEIMRLMSSYTHTKNTFLEFLTFLLPRRISSVLWKESKDMTSQFICNSIDGLDANKLDNMMHENDDNVVDSISKEYEEPDILNFLTMEEYQILVDYIVEGYSISQVADEYNMKEDVCERRINELTHRVRIVLENIKQNSKEGIDVGIQPAGNSKRKTEKQKRILDSKELQQDIHANGGVSSNRRKSIWKVFKTICNRIIWHKKRSTGQQRSVDVRIR